MGKLTKEQVYVNLKGKSKEELTDLYEFLVENKQEFNYGCDSKIWLNGIGVSEKTEVTIEQLKQIIKPSMEKELKIEDIMIDTRPLRESCIKLIENIFLSKGHRISYKRGAFSKGNDFIMAECKNPDGKTIISVEKFLKKFNKETSLTDQLTFHQNEVIRIQNLIEEENKPKVGDVGLFYNLIKKDGFVRILKKINEYDGKIYYDPDIRNYGLGFQNFEPLPTELQEQLKPYLDSFVLPEKWCIRFDSENVGYLGLYFEGNAGYFKNDFENVILFSSGNEEFKTKKLCYDLEDYTEITFEQFKKYVLNGKNI